MKGKKAGIVSLALVLSGILSVAGAFASYKSQLKVRNNIKAGIVDIKVEEYSESKETGEIEAVKDPRIEVLPSEEVSRITRITNLEAPCYIRARVNWDTKGYKAGGGNLFTIGDKDIKGISDNWLKVGDWYYYKKALDTHDNVDFFKSIIFPSKYTERDMTQHLIINVDVDAVQAQNFTPNFGSSDPWYGVDIIKSTKSRSGDVDTVSYRAGNMKVTFNGNSGQLISNTDDFFKAFGEMMPGDIKEGSVSVKNNTKDIQDLSLSMTLPKTYYKSQYDLLSLVNIKILNDKEIVYEGSIADSYNVGEINLGRYKKGSSSTLSFIVSMSTNVTNRLALTEAEVDWTFKASSVDKGEKIPNKTVPQKNGGSGNTTAEYMDGKGSVVPVKTGDNTDAVRYTAMMLSGAVLIFLILANDRKRRYIREE